LLKPKLATRPLRMRQPKIRMRLISLCLASSLANWCPDDFVAYKKACGITSFNFKFEDFALNLLPKPKRKRSSHLLWRMASVDLPSKKNKFSRFG
jgi:hypothetical protein